jgi:hypothetical protein
MNYQKTTIKVENNDKTKTNKIKINFSDSDLQYVAHQLEEIFIEGGEFFLRAESEFDENTVLVFRKVLIKNGDIELVNDPTFSTDGDSGMLIKSLLLIFLSIIGFWFIIKSFFQ